MRIGELAHASGVAASTIRFYESKGLLPAARRRPNGYRIYDGTALERLQLIHFAQSLGFALDELPPMLNDDHGWDHKRILVSLKHKRDDVDNRIEHLTCKRRQIDSLIGQLETSWQEDECLSSEELAGLQALARR